jgi:hypothetical protein
MREELREGRKRNVINGTCGKDTENEQLRKEEEEIYT